MPSRSHSVAVDASPDRGHPCGRSKHEKADRQSLQHDIASFAASLGLHSHHQPYSGFNDIDFRKSGSIAPHINKKTIELGEQVQSKHIGKHKPKHKNRNEQEKSKIESKRPNSTKSRSAINFTEKENKSRDPPTLSSKDSLAHNKKEKDNRAGFDKEGHIHGSVGNRAQGLHRFSAQVCKQLIYGGASEESGFWYEASQNLEARVSLNVATTSTLNPAGGKHESKPPTRKENEHDGVMPVSQEILETKRQEGQDLLENLALAFQNHRNRDSSSRFLITAQKAGTSADKVAAMTVLIQSNPLANLSTLDTLLGFVTSKGGKRKASLGIDVLKELFITCLLPGRKLMHLRQKPLEGLPESIEGATLLLYWLWEDCLKDRYAKFVGAIVEATKDSLPYLKQKAIKTVYELLKAKPEQERTLLSALINKLGDPERKVCSTASYLLSCLLTAHPNMKKIVVAEVESFVFRPHVGLRAKYYAVVFLNQLLLSNRGDGPKVAKQLIGLYFAVFKVISTGEGEPGLRLKLSSISKRRHTNEQYMKKKDAKRDVESPEKCVCTGVEMDSRLLSALLTGINRAFPYVLTDDGNEIIEEHTPTLFRIVHSKNLNVGIQALMLLYQLLIKSQAVSDRFYRALYAVLLSEGLAKFSKAEMLLGIVFKAMKSDIDLKRVAAFAKRLMQVALQQPPEFVCGSLILISEILKARPPLWDAVLLPAIDDDVEHFEDVEEPECKIMEQKFLRPLSTNTKTLELENGYVHHNKQSGSCQNGEESSVKETAACSSWKQKQPGYNPRLREPSFCHADQSCWWELSVLAVHFHPSVATMAHTLLSGQNLIYGGDPFRDLSLGSFLDRFSEKKPKARRQQLDTAGQNSRILIRYNQPVGVELVKVAIEDVAPEDVVFHKFYSSKLLHAHKPQKKKEADSELLLGDAGDEDDFVGGEESDEEVDALLDQDDTLAMEEMESEETEDSSIELHSQDSTGSKDKITYMKRQSKQTKMPKKLRKVNANDFYADFTKDDDLPTHLSIEEVHTKKRKKLNDKATQVKFGNIARDESKPEVKFSRPKVNKLKGHTKPKKYISKHSIDFDIPKSSPFAMADDYTHIVGI